MNLRGLLASAAIVVAAVLVSEIGVRAWFWTPQLAASREGDGLGNARYAFGFAPGGDLVPNQDGHWVIWWRRPYHVETNSLGFRGAEERDKAARTIVALGDSQTFGPYVATEDAWPAWTQNALRRLPDFGPVQVFNASIAGYTMADQLAWLKDKGLAFKPDMIVLGVFENDIGDYRRVLTGRASRLGASRGAADEANAPGALDELRVFLGHNAALYNLASQIKNAARQRAAGIDTRRGEGDAALVQPDLGAEFARLAAAYEADFRQFAALARAAGIALAVVAIPSPSVLAEGMRAEVAPLVARLCAELDLPFLDPFDEFAAQPDTAENLYLLHWSAAQGGYTGNGHLSRMGHSLIGRRVAAWLDGLGREAR